MQFAGTLYRVHSIAVGVFRFRSAHITLGIYRIVEFQLVGGAIDTPALNTPRPSLILISVLKPP